MPECELHTSVQQSVYLSYTLGTRVYQLKTSVQEQHKLTYAVYAPHNAIRFPTSNHITYVKMVEIGAKLRELQMSSYDISNMSCFRIFCQLKIYARKTARETYAVFDFYGGNFLRLATAYELYGGGSGAYLQVQLCITDLHYFHCINLTNDRFSIRVAHRLLVGPMVIVCTVLWPSVMLYAVTFSASLC